ncbi:hypothetical protein C8J57DRAFT_1327780 [Mycena rebaudengoi]|nr:hypothetical protein C8J57DRAFT_1327780 [Mycena rebaudengoi]
MAGFTSTEAFFVSLFCEASLHGMYTILFASTVYMLSKNKGRMNNVMTRTIVLLIVIMYCISTAHVSIAMAQDYRAFVTDPETVGDNTDSIGNTPVLVQLALEVTNCILADTIIIWRAYVLYGNNKKIVAAPILMIAATGVTGYILVSRVSAVARHSTFDSIFTDEVQSWSITFSVLTLATNFISTGLIAGRIWYHARQLRNIMGTVGHSGTSKRYQSIIALVIESGLLYSLAWLITIILNVAGSAAIVVTVDMIAQLTGIIPTLIVLLIINKADADTTRTVALSTFHNSNTRNTQPRHPRHNTNDAATYQLDPIPINLEAGKSYVTQDSSELNNSLKMR